MTILARYTQLCSECQTYIVTGKDQITRLHWVHEKCYTMFWKDLIHEKRKEEERQDQLQLIEEDR